MCRVLGCSGLLRESVVTSVTAGDVPRRNRVADQTTGEPQEPPTYRKHNQPQPQPLRRAAIVHFLEAAPVLVVDREVTIWGAQGRLRAGPQPRRHSAAIRNTASGSVRAAVRCPAGEPFASIVEGVDTIVILLACALRVPVKSTRGQAASRHLWLG